MSTTLLGVPGTEGSFSEEAALLYAKRNAIKPLLIYLHDMKNVLASLEVGTIDIGILPVINLRGGLVKPAFQAMGKHLFTPIDEIWLEIRQSLLVKPGTTKQQITQIVSHPQGFAQCEFYLQKEFRHVERMDSVNTAIAAKDLAEGRLPATTAVIASQRAAQIYGLETMTHNIQDTNPNLTVFLLAKRHE